MGDQQDVFEMSEEEFQAALAGSGAEEQEEEQEEQEQNVTFTQEGGEQEQEQETAGQEEDPFKFNEEGFQSSQQEQDSAQQAAGEQKHRIIHNGQEHYVTQQELIDLAQKGFDYNQKTSKIAPHRRLVELIEEDEELKEKINQHVVGKYVPDISERDNYESEEEWLKDNLSRTVSKVSPFIGSESGEDSGQQDQTAAQQGAQNQEPEIVTALRNRDPQNFNMVRPYMQKAIGNLTVQQYKDISNDPQKIVQLYDMVSERVRNMNPQQQTQQTQQSTGQGGQSTAASRPKAKNFNLRSGQGSNNSPGPQKKNVWDMSNKDFNALRQNSLGY